MIAIWKDQVQHSTKKNPVFLEDFCYSEFLAYYTLENKSSKTCEYQSDDNLIENNHEEYSYQGVLQGKGKYSMRFIHGLKIMYNVMAT